MFLCWTPGIIWVGSKSSPGSCPARPGHAPGESTTGKNPGCWCWVAGGSLWEHSREGEGHKYVDFPFISDFWWLIIRGKIRWKLDQILHFVEFSMHHHFSVVFSICKCMTFLSVLKEVNQIVLNPPYFPRGEKRLDIRGLFYKTPSWLSWHCRACER